MASITDPQAIKFVNEQVRPMCEIIRALMAKIDALQVTWDAELAKLFPNDDSPVEDGREKEGVSRLTGADVNSAIGVMQAIAGEKNNVIISKPCVRVLEAS